MTTAIRVQNFRHQIAGVELNVQYLQGEEQVKKAPLIFLHDALGSIPQWRDFPRELAARTGRDAWLLERQGHGRSAPLSGERQHTYLHREAQEVLPQWLHAIDTPGPILIGHSDGGTIALIFAAYFDPKAVVAMAPHIFVEEQTLAGIREAVERKEHIQNRLSRFHGSKTETLFKAWADTWLSPGFRFWDIRRELESVSCPLLLIQGDKDDYGSLEQIKEVCRRARGECTQKVFSKTGHFPHHEKKKEVIDAIAYFLESIN